MLWQFLSLEIDINTLSGSLVLGKGHYPAKRLPPRTNRIDAEDIDRSKRRIKSKCFMFARIYLLFRFVL
jgi:hypothetical protein